MQTCGLISKTLIYFSFTFIVKAPNTVRVTSIFNTVVQPLPVIYYATSTYCLLIRR